MTKTIKLGPTATVLRKRFGRRLQEYRETTGLTQRDLAIALELDYYTMISQVERGLAKIPPQDLPTWAKMLRRDLKEFTTEYLYWCEPYIYAGLFGVSPIDREGLPHTPHKHVKRTQDSRPTEAGSDPEDSEVQ